MATKKNQSKVRRVRTPKGGVGWRKAFLADLAKHGEVVAAAKLAMVGKSTIYDHQVKDPDFAQQVAAAKECYRARILEEMQRRAIEGVDEPIMFEGQQVLTVKKYSDQLLMSLAKAAMPREFGTKVEHSGSVGSDPDQIVLVHTAPPDSEPAKEK